VQALATASEVERRLALERFRLLGLYLQHATAVGCELQTPGLAGLVRQGRTDIGERRTTSPHLRKAVEDLLWKAPLHLNSMHRQVKQFAQMIGEPAQVTGSRVTSCAVCRVTSERLGSMTPADSESHVGGLPSFSTTLSGLRSAQQDAGPPLTQLQLCLR
jgi:hypothetical protein